MHNPTPAERDEGTPVDGVRRIRGDMCSDVIEEIKTTKETILESLSETESRLERVKKKFNL